MADEQRVIHDYLRPPALVGIKLEKNSRGVNWEISFAAPTAEEALAVIRETHARLQAEYGEG